MPRKTVYSVALMSRWGPSHLAATPRLLPLIFPESFRQACAATLCPSHPMSSCAFFWVSALCRERGN